MHFSRTCYSPRPKRKAAIGWLTSRPRRVCGADRLRANVDLRDPCPRRIELAIRKVGPEHQERVALLHGVIARREADEPCHADIVGIVPFDMLPAAQRIHHRGLQLFGQRDDFVMRALASSAAEYRHAACAIEQIREPLHGGTGRHDVREAWKPRRQAVHSVAVHIVIRTIAKTVMTCLTTSAARRSGAKKY
jgi:hypothetical protein